MEKGTATTMTTVSSSKSSGSSGCNNNNNEETEDGCGGDSSSSSNDLVLFEHQVSGHGTAEKGLLKNKQGHILKPLQPPPKGQREVMFYEKVQEQQQQHGQGDDTSCHYSELREFIPKYFGVVHLRQGATTSLSPPQECSKTTADKTRTPYIILQDTLEGLPHPCVMDLKIGARTWSPDASEAKIKQEMSKYRGTKGVLGLCLTGMHYYRVHANNREGRGYSIESTRLGRDEGKGLDVAGFKHALEKYFNLDGDEIGGSSGDSSSISINIKRVMLRVLQEVINRLRKIERVFEKQTGFRVYGSSLLLAYDVEGVLQQGGGLLEGANKCDDDDKKPQQPPHEYIRVNMIDFAHYHEVGEEKHESLLDENYLFGIRNLVRVLCDIVREKKGEEEREIGGDGSTTLKSS